MNRYHQFTETWQKLKGKLDKHWAQLTDNLFLKIAGDDEKPLRSAVQGHYSDQKEEAASWAEDWCERGGWRNNPPAPLRH